MKCVRLRFRVEGSGFRAWGFRVQGLRLEDLGVEFRAWGFRCRV